TDAIKKLYIAHTLNQFPCAWVRICSPASISCQFGAFSFGFDKHVLLSRSKNPNGRFPYLFAVWVLSLF
ncbi:MAG: hypothetical protein J6U68_02630, partial [Clostridia bacterium]|nr:hypothetical protein [Clostridia bacterium]